MWTVHLAVRIVNVSWSAFGSLEVVHAVTVLNQSSQLVMVMFDFAVFHILDAIHKHLERYKDDVVVLDKC